MPTAPRFSDLRSSATHAAAVREAVPRGSVRLPRLASVASALPANAAPQSATRALAARMFEEGLVPVDLRLIGVFDSSGIDTRHFCMPLEWYAEARRFGEMNARYVEHAVALGAEAASRALARAGRAMERVNRGRLGPKGLLLLTLLLKANHPPPVPLHY